MNKIAITDPNYRYEEFKEDQYIMYQCYRDPETKKFIYSEVTGINICDFYEPYQIIKVSKKIWRCLHYFVLLYYYRET